MLLNKYNTLILVINTILGIIAGLIVMNWLISFYSLNSSNSIIAVIYKISSLLLIPFKGLFTDIDFKNKDIYTEMIFLALIYYTVLFILSTRLIVFLKEKEKIKNPFGYLWEHIYDQNRIQKKQFRLPTPSS